MKKVELISLFNLSEAEMTRKEQGQLKGESCSCSCTYGCPTLTHVMIKKILIMLLFIVPMLVSCIESINKIDSRSNSINSKTHNDIDQSNLITIDLDEEYPKTSLSIEEIANVEYLQLETTNNAFISSVSNIAMSNKLIIICDRLLGEIFLFDRKGKYLNTISNRGNGPNEYNSISNFCVDFNKEEIYVCDYQLKYRILTYSFEGEFIRSTKLIDRIWPETIYSCDENYFIVLNSNISNTTSSSKTHNPYKIINKNTGKIVDLPIKTELRETNYSLSKKGDIYNYSKINIDQIIKAKDGFIISDFVIDTIYHYKNGNLNPIAIIKKNHSKNNSNLLSSVNLITNKYIFVNVIKKEINNNTKQISETDQRYLFYNKAENRIYETEIYSSDITNSKEMQWDSYGMDLPDGCFIKVFYADRLIDLLENNRIHGKLKEEALILEENSNPILMIVCFK